MQISVYISGGCFGVPRSASVDTAPTTDPVTTAENQTLETLAGAAKLATRPLGAWSTAPKCTVTIGAYTATYDSLGMPEPVSALVSAVFAAAERRGPSGPGRQIL